MQGGYSPIISAGGDGSINEVINGIMQAQGQNGLDNQHIPVGILPLGSVNDLVNNLGLPKDLPGAAQVIAVGNTRPMDLCQIIFGDQHQHCYFGNNSAVGLEPTITLIQEEIGYLSGALRYLVAALRGIWRNPQWTMQLECEVGKYDGPVTLVTVGNGPVTGGLFYMAPHADPFDGLLTFVYGFMPTRLKIYRLLPRTLKSGKGSYVEHPSIHEIHSSWLRLHFEQPTPLHADGEIQSKAVFDVEYRIIPARLPILINM